MNFFADGLQDALDPRRTDHVGAGNTIQNEMRVFGGSMIVDAHVHTGGFGGYSTEDVLRIADRVGIDKIFATDITALHYNSSEGNLRLSKEMKQHPDRIIGYASLSSARFGREAVEEVQRCYEVYGMRGLKIIHQTAGLGSYSLLTTINEPAMYPIVAKAAEFGMPILAHATAEECAGLCDVVPEAIFIMAHTGGHPTAMGDWFRAIEVAGIIRDIYLILPAHNLIWGILKPWLPGLAHIGLFLEQTRL